MWHFFGMLCNKIEIISELQKRVTSIAFNLPNVFSSNIHWNRHALQSRFSNELRCSTRYNHTGSRISARRSLFPVNWQLSDRVLNSNSGNSLRTVSLDKIGRNKCVEISRKQSTAQEKVPRLLKTEFMKCGITMRFGFIIKDSHPETASPFLQSSNPLFLLFTFPLILLPSIASNNVTRLWRKRSHLSTVLHWSTSRSFVSKRDSEATNKAEKFV